MQQQVKCDEQKLNKKEYEIILSTKLAHIQ